jgi:putative ABC transport system permease protein
MFKSVLAAALNNLARNRLYAAISILSLAIGMATAILTGLYVRDELSFDRFIPGYRNVYVVVAHLHPPGRPTLITDATFPPLGAALKSEFSDIQATARLLSTSTAVGRGEVTSLEAIAFVDPDFFSILPLPAIAGDPVAAVHRPDGAVITRALARKVFGQDAPIGQTIELNRATKLRVDAVIKDLPANSHLDQDVFISGLNALSPLRPANDRPLVRGQISLSYRTYFRVPNPEAGERLDREMPGFLARRLLLPNGRLQSGSALELRMIPLAGLHLYPLTGLSSAKPQGSRAILTALSLIAGLVLTMAAINFVNLMTARAARRAVEVGVRKAAGATRRDLILQFIGEAVIYALVALVLGIGVVELALPSLRAMLDRPLDFAYWREPQMLVGGMGLCLVVGVLAGLYPALVQSSFRPAAVLKGVLPQTTGSAKVRSSLATLQFAFLIGLILAVMVIAGQTHYALNDGLRLDKAQMVMMDVRAPPGPPKPRCREAFVDQVRRLPGVQGAACANLTAFDESDVPVTVDLPGGRDLQFTMGIVDHGFFELYGLKPLAGRFFSPAHPEDETPIVQPLKPGTVVLNQTAARALGYASPEQAVGRRFRNKQYGSFAAGDLEIVGVAPDFSFDLINHGVRPMAYFLVPQALDTLSIKLKGQDVPETLKAIDDLWRQSGAVRPPSRRFVDDYLQSVYIAAIRQGWLIDALCGLAIFIACLGLLGLAAFTAERRTKEIGIRKAMGASSPGIVGMLLWSFSQPVLWANLIAWPIAWWALNRWLQAFGRRIELEPWMFLAAGAAALLIAVLTVASHAIRVAQAKPVGALRYE